MPLPLFWSSLTHLPPSGSCAGTFDWLAGWSCVVIARSAHWPLLTTHMKSATNMIRTCRHLDNFCNKTDREVTAARIAQLLAWNCCDATKTGLSENFCIMERISLGNLGRIQGPTEVSCEEPLVSATTYSQGQ